MNIFEKRESAIRGYCRTYPTVFDTAVNARQTDVDGKSYIDFFAGAGVLNFGHNNPQMKQAVIEYLQGDGVLHSLDMYSSAKQRFLERFVDVILTPRKMNHRVQFMGPTGTNAVETALKLARRVTGREDVVAFTQGFHGMTLGALACTANSYFRNAAGTSLPHVIRAPYGCEPQCADCEMGCGLESLQQLRKQFENPTSGLPKPAAFILETIQAEGGVRVAGTKWLLEVQKLAHDLGALLIVDEIQVGCGRTGSYFSFDNTGLDPDIVALAKGIGGLGTPLAMNLVKPEHDDYWQPSEHTGTFRGQGISFVAGTEALQFFEDDALMQQVQRFGTLMQEKLSAIAEQFPAHGIDVRGTGMIRGIDLRDGPLSKAVVSECFKNGLLVGGCGAGGKVIKLMPPLTIPEADLREGLEIFAQAAERKLKKAGKK